ncbi:hypothetical protein ALI144C_31350 [Actinosynnema sp. ALI-1.44]|uniref:NAD(P)/FAD-dependent oxidoreductase n=1 Tax=Actinosynnema sp. ALI-1.44 TaxID=1933779 RepID=UPI00097C097C|nr:FAD-dependent oxidoreductase [Actinosynnema sp. ALI-1.44]ONI78133.1 hypothetical protein ALI144C_31350 [Actinosynnema sp. ALI-1.44]
MRICVIGAGLAGALLAWRLAQQEVRVTLVTGNTTNQDASRASAGLVRAFEPDRRNADQAGRGLAELRASAVLSGWACYREAGSLYLPTAPIPVAALAEIDHRLPGSVSLVDAAEVATRFGLSPVDAPPALLERHAGFIHPDRLRHNVCADLLARGGEVRQATVTGLRQERGGGWSCRVAGRFARADTMVLATGAWTPALLSTTGLAGGGLRAKVIQYARYRVRDHSLPAFVDEHTGLYGRPAGPGELLLGLPTERWNATPGQAHASATEERAVRAAAARRLPAMATGTPVEVTAAVDAYAPDGRLVLRRVPGAPGRLFTFTGGSGGAAKTALAASADAAGELLERRSPDQPTPMAEGTQT